MFIRALEGAYITLDENKKLFLHRSKYTDDGEFRIFESARCDDCGRIGIAGKEVHGFLEFSNDRWDKTTEVFLLQGHLCVPSPLRNGRGRNVPD